MVERIPENNTTLTLLNSTQPGNTNCISTNKSEDVNIEYSIKEKCFPDCNSFVTQEHIDNQIQETELLMPKQELNETKISNSNDEKMIAESENNNSNDDEIQIDFEKSFSNEKPNEQANELNSGEKIL